MKPKHKAARKNHPQANGTSEPKASETGAAKANMQPSDNKAAQSAETKPAAPSAHYVSLKDVMDALTPEQRQETLAWFTAVGCPDNIAAQLTPEQRAQRERYRAEKWAEYDAKWKEFEESEPKPAKRYGEAIDTLNDFMEQEEWFAKNTPHPFRIQHWPRIANLAQFLCDDLQRLARFGNQEAIRTVARISVETTETLTELLNSESEAAIQNA